MSKTKRFNKIVPLVIYPYDIMFSIGESDKKFLKTIKSHIPIQHHLDIEEDEISNFTPQHRGRAFHHLIGGWTVIRFPSIPTTSEHRGTVAHEIFHAVDFIFRRIGLTLTSASDEAYAYLIGYLTEQFYNIIEDKG